MKNTSVNSLSNKGQRIREFFNSESRALIEMYKNIEHLIPSSNNRGSAHVAEEGRFVESLIRSFLNKHLPKELEALSGFIIRPATKVGDHDRTRRAKEDDQHSKQLDVIVFDSANYPIYERFEEFAIVPAEGVVGIISVKKNLYLNQIEHELSSLSHAAKLCVHKNRNKNVVRSPATCLLSFGSKIQPAKKISDRMKSIFTKIQETYQGRSRSFDECVGQIICLSEYTVFKERPNSPKESKFNSKAEFLGFNHFEKQELHLGLQFLITGILSAYHDETRNPIARPGFTSFQSGRAPDIHLGELNVSGLRMHI
ncbi:MAG: hypothetical protein RIC80_05835 [Cyclobacteriaceae bacterium]